MCGRYPLRAPDTLRDQKNRNLSMRSANPIENTGAIYRKNDGAFLGSCFFFRYPETILTAGHCVKEYCSNDIMVHFPGSRASRPFQVVDIHTAKDFDIAVLRIKDIDERDITWVANEIFD